MPRLAILSDVHGNQEALESVLQAIAADGVDHLFHLGDLVGYNANPRECLQIFRQQRAVSVLGNHDLAVLDPQMAESFNVLAHKALHHTREQLDTHDLRYLQGLPRMEVIWDRYLLCHGSPENIEAYIANLFQAKRTFNLVRKCFSGISACFFGHTHVQKLWMCDHRGKVLALPVTTNPIQLDPESMYLINPGSVGQPRQGDSRAHYLLFDSSQEIVWFKAIPYDVKKAQEKIINARLPAYLADRLQDGI